MEVSKKRDVCGVNGLFTSPANPIGGALRGQEGQQRFSTCFDKRKQHAGRDCRPCVADRRDRRAGSAFHRTLGEGTSDEQEWFVCALWFQRKTRDRCRRTRLRNLF